MVRRQRGPFVDSGSLHAGLTAGGAMVLTPHVSAAPVAFSGMNPQGRGSTRTTSKPAAVIVAR